MIITRLFTGEDNQSYFEDINVELADAEIGKISNPIDTEEVVLGEIDGVDVVDWHNAPRRQYIIMLKGAMEIEIGNGTKRIFKEGEILLAEDMTGKGHITRAASKGIRQYIAIPLK